MRFPGSPLGSATFVDQDSGMVVPPKLNEANFKTIRLHFYPPRQRVIHPRGPFDFAHRDELAPGIEIRFGSGAMFSPFAMGSYPQSAEVLADMQRIYFPSANTRRWLEDKLQRGENNNIPAIYLGSEQARVPGCRVNLEGTGFPFGVVILRFRMTCMKTLVVLWGQPLGPKGPKAWFTAMSWTTVAERCGLGQVPDSERDLVSAAKAIFYGYDAWIRLVDMDSTGFAIDLDESPGRIRFAVDKRDFFGRPFLSVNMTVEGVEMDQGELKGRILHEHNRVQSGQSRA